MTHALVKRQLEKRLRQIKYDIAKIDAAMLEMAHQDQRMNERLDILSSIPGIGVTTALIILVDMPEIGALDGKQVASLAGLAPLSHMLGNCCRVVDVTEFWEMAGKGADTGRAPKSATCHLHARTTRQGEEKTNERYHWDRSLTGRLMQSIHREGFRR